MIVGIDIGTQGALALLTPEGELIDVADMPCLKDGPKGRPHMAPTSWKRAVGLSLASKDASRSEAIRRWPQHAALFARVKDDDRAEAALIAVAGLLKEAKRHG